MLLPLRLCISADQEKAAAQRFRMTRACTIEGHYDEVIPA